MIVNHQALLRTLAAAALLALSVTQAHAETYNYSQSFGTYSVSGQFSGVDADGDGILDASEVTPDSLSLSGSLGNHSYTAGDITFGTFQWVLSDLGDLTNPSSGFNVFAMPASGIALNWLASEAVGLGMGEGMLYLFDAATFDPIPGADPISAIGSANVTPVPEPESYLMMAMGLAGIAAAARRKRAA